MTRGKREQVGADTFVAAGLAEGDGFDQLPREEVAHHLERHGDEFLIRWPAHRVECVVTSLREHSEGITGELAVSHGGVELHWARLSFASTQTREGVVKKLAGILPDVPWRTIIEVVCRTTVRALRESSTTVPLIGRRASRLRFLVDPLLPLGQVAVIFGDGGVGKGQLAVVLARAVAHEAPLPSGLFAPLPGPVLYLDWESDHEDLDDRVALHGGPGGGEGLHYRRMHRPLADEAPALRADVSRLGIMFVIVDSLAPAAAPEPEGADAALRTHNAIRGLGPITCLCLAHVSKAGADQRGPARPFGSVFVQNMARSVWEMRRSEDQDGDELRVALYHRKANRTRLRPPLGFRFHFTDDRITVQNADLAEAPDLLARASASTQVLSALRTGAKSIARLAEDLGLKPETVKRTLQRLAQRDKVVRLSEAHGGKGQEIPWGLRG